MCLFNRCYIVTENVALCGNRLISELAFFEIAPYQNFNLINVCDHCSAIENL